MNSRTAQQGEEREERLILVWSHTHLQLFKINYLKGPCTLTQSWENVLWATIIKMTGVGLAVPGIKWDFNFVVKLQKLKRIKYLFL